MRNMQVEIAENGRIALEKIEKALSDIGGAYKVKYGRY